jgi:hypothetical protein
LRRVRGGLGGGCESEEEREEEFHGSAGGSA